MLRQRRRPWPDLIFAQRWTNRIDFSNRPAAEEDLRRSNALAEPEEVREQGLRLLLL